MAHSHRLSNRHIEALWEETRRLNEEVATLQSQLATYEDNEDSTQGHAASPARDMAPDQPAAVWNVWPYKQAISAYYFCFARFHSFHRNLFVGWLTWHNRRAQAAFAQARGQDESKLKLIA